MELQGWAAAVSVLLAFLTGLLGKDFLGKFMTGRQKFDSVLSESKMKQEQTAQQAIIDLAREAIRGWREESSAVVRLSEIVQAHDATSGERYSTLTKFHEGQETRMEDIDRQLTALVNVLSSQRSNRQVGE